MGFLAIELAVGFKIGTVILEHSGYPTAYFVYLGLQLASFTYIMIVIKDHEDFNRHENTGMSVCQKASGLFQLQGIKDNWKVLRKRRFGYNRFHIGLLLAAYTAMVMCIESRFSTKGTQLLCWCISQQNSLSSKKQFFRNYNMINRHWTACDAMKSQLIDTWTSHHFIPLKAIIFMNDLPWFVDKLFFPFSSVQGNFLPALFWRRGVVLWEWIWLAHGTENVVFYVF